MEKTKVSILASVYNGEKYIANSIESILKQTLNNFEFLIAEDGSNDLTFEILKEYSKKDKRIKIFKNKHNIGLTKSLNLLLEAVRGEFIARIDLDDICDEKRIEDQVNFLNSNESFGMVTSCYKLIDEKENELYSHCPSCDCSSLKWSLIFRNNIRHSTTMWRSKLKLFYDTRFKYAQDYEMWARMSRITNIGTINKITTQIRNHEKAISNNFMEEQENFAVEVTKSQFEFYTNKKISLEEAKNLRLIYFLKSAVQFEQMEKINSFDFKNSINLYLFLLEKFLEKEKPKKEFIIEVEYDINSLINNKKRKNSTIYSLAKWFKKNKKNEFIEKLKENFSIENSIWKKYPNKIHI